MATKDLGKPKYNLALDVRDKDKIKELFCQHSGLLESNKIQRRIESLIRRLENCHVTDKNFLIRGQKEWLDTREAILEIKEGNITSLSQLGLAWCYMKKDYIKEFVLFNYKPSGEIGLISFDGIDFYIIPDEVLTAESTRRIEPENVF